MTGAGIIMTGFGPPVYSLLVDVGRRGRAKQLGQR